MSKIEFRSDRGELRRFEEVSGGGIRVDAALTRVGVFEYRDAEGNISRELKAPEDVFSMTALQSLKDAPVTIDHPADFVDPWNWKEHAVGHVSSVPGRDAAKADTVGGPLVIQDADAIRRVDSGDIKEVSLGYFAEIVDSPGVFEGQPYDRIQRNPVYNHVALGPQDWGRLGPEISLKINRNDSVNRCDGSAHRTDARRAPKTPAKNQPLRRQNRKPTRQRKPMNLIQIGQDGGVQIDGVPYQLEGASLASARDALHKACDRARQDATDESQSAVGSLVNAAEALFKQAALNHDLQKEIAQLKAVDLDAAADARAELITRAREVAPGLETQGKSAVDIMRDALEAAKVTVPKDADESYLRGRLDAFDVKRKDSKPPKQRQSLDGLGGGGGDKTFDQLIAEAEQKRNDSMNNAWKPGKEA